MILKLTDLENVFNKFIDDATTTLAASLAFYTALSIGPLLVIFVTITSHFSPSLQEAFLSQTRDLTGPEGAEALNMIITSAKARADLSGFAGFMGVLILLISASLIFGELRFALNKIFNCEPDIQDNNQSYLKLTLIYIKEKTLKMGLALSFLILLIISLYASSFKSEYLIVNVLFSFFFVMLFFSSMFRYITRPRVPWPQAWRGGLLTSALFVFGREVISVYLRESAVGSAYGAAGSVIVLMAWIYYTSLIILCGAQFSSILIKPKKRNASNV